MLSLTTGTLIAEGVKKNKENFKLFFKDEDGDPHIDVKDIFSRQNRDSLLPGRLLTQAR